MAFIIAGVMSFMASQAQARPLEPISSHEIETRLREFKHIPFDGHFTEKMIDFKVGCKASLVKMAVHDPHGGSPREITVQVVRPRVNEKVPVVIVVPTIVGQSILEPSIAFAMCRKNIASIIADINDASLPKTYPSWDLENNRLLASTFALRTVIDFAESYPAFDKSRIGMMGTSLGGISTAFMAGIEPERLRALVISVGGGNLPYVLSTSIVPHVSLLRWFRMAAADMDDNIEYELKLQKEIRYDPIHFASRAKPERIMMVLSSTDIMVPYSAQRDLFDAFQDPPSYLFYRSGHLGAIIEVVYFNMDKIIRFFEDRFSGGDTYFEEELADVN